MALFRLSLFPLALAAIITSAAAPTAASAADCPSLPDHGRLKEELARARTASNGGLNNEMWAAVVNRDGVVCAVAFSGKDRGDQWPGSRLIAVQKANTANSFSLAKFAVSTANLYFAAQPGGSLFGLSTSVPLDTQTALSGNPVDFGTPQDPLVGKAPGGVIVFGGGLALYDKEHQLVGALGVSGDTSCADHNIAWRLRNGLTLDYVPGGVTSDKERPDNIVYDIVPMANRGSGHSPSGWGHPSCNADVAKIARELPAARK